MKKVLSLLLVAAMALMLVACGGSSSSTPAASGSTAASGSAEAPTGQTLKVMLSEEPSSGDSFTTTLNKWAEETGNSVELMVIPYDDQLTKFPLMAKNKDLPDLVSTTRLSRLYPDEFVDLGQVVDTSIFEPMALEIISQEYNSDKLSCLPLQFTITNVFYNKDAFEAAGLEVPTVDDRWTMDEVYEAAAKLMADGGVKYGMAVDFSRARYDNLMYMNGGSMVEKDGDSFKVAINSQVPTVDDRWTMDEVYEAAAKLMADGGVKYGMAVDFSRARYDNLMYMNGGSMVEKDGDSFKVAINSQANIDTLQTFVDKNNEGIMPKAIWAGGSTDNPGDYFKNGDVGMYFSGSWNYNAFTTDITGFEWGVMPSPVGSVSGSAILGGSGLAVPENSANKDLALSFIKWFYEEENFSYYLDLDKGLSSLTGVTYQPADEKAAADYTVLQAEVGQTTTLFSVDESSMWRNYLDNEYRDALKQAVNGDMTAEEALNDFAAALAEKSGWAQ